MSSPLLTPPPLFDIVCLCAAWCGTCREYEPLFAEVQAALPGHRYRWIDIEDEADLIGDIDVETFPTLLIAHQGQVLFAGPVLPRAGDAVRLIESQLELAGQVKSAAAMGLTLDQAEAFRLLAAQLG